MTRLYYNANIFNNSVTITSTLSRRVGQVFDSRFDCVYRLYPVTSRHTSRHHHHAPLVLSWILWNHCGKGKRKRRANLVSQKRESPSHCHPLPLPCRPLLADPYDPPEATARTSSTMSFMASLPRRPRIHSVLGDYCSNTFTHTKTQTYTQLWGPIV